MKNFDLISVPLEGWNLLEANAGTGKTYSICGLYLRLILEKSLAHDQIITITFTRAATGELRSRLIKTLLQARKMLSPGQGASEEDQTDPIALICRPWLGQLEALERIDLALRSFDLAPVLTIHSFCQRVLTESSLTTGFNVDARVLDQSNEVLADLVQESWQSHLETLSPALVRYLQTFDRQSLSNTIGRLLSRPFAQIQGPTVVDPGLQFEAIEPRRREAGELWDRDQTQIRDLLLAAQPGLKQNVYGPQQLARYIRLVPKYLRYGLDEKALEQVAKLGQKKLLAGLTRKATLTPEHPFFQALQECIELEQGFNEACKRYQDNLPRLLLDDVTERLKLWKASSDCLTFDDLIQQLDHALDQPQIAHALVSQAGKRYGALLVDEYQDTDPLQAAIFRRLFEPMSIPVWRVGDPKQSLYGFRGADLHAYLAAREGSPNCYRLTRDWRAQPALIEVINHLFSAVPDPFVLPQVQFAASEPAPMECLQLEVDGTLEPAMTTWLAGSGQDECAQLCAGAIARLLSLGSQSRAFLRQGTERRSLTAEHIAVLVRSNSQAQRIATALQSYGIASSRAGVNSVFDTAEAGELERLLHGVAMPATRNRVAGALATQILGLNALQVAQFSADEQIQDQWSERFRRWRDIWSVQGLYPMLMAVLREAGVAERILPMPAGQSVMANLLHLADLMEVNTGGGYSLSEQIRWLSGQRAGPFGGDESTIVRLDRETNVVRIATVHRAKGAQYPVVFCPFLWRSYNPPRQYVEVHEEGQLVLDFGTGQQDQRRGTEKAERISENSRLAYVALTRAQASCYVPWSIESSSGTAESGLSHLLNPEHAGSFGIPPGKPDYPALRDQFLQGFAAAGATVLTQPPTFSGRLDSEVSWPLHKTPLIRPQRHWQVTSYSSLFSGAGQDRDIDETVSMEPAMVTVPDFSIFSLPAGPQTGLMMHELLENLTSFSMDIAGLEKQAVHYLQRYNLDRRFAPALGANMHILLNQPLGPDQLVLSQLPRVDRLTEMEFHLNLPGLNPGDLWPLVRCESAPEYFDCRRVSGFLHGFVDLVVKWQGRYWVIDYKSNHLGQSAPDYHPDQLLKDVRLHDYDFQYHLYLLALDQHLQQALPDYHFDNHMGGVLYLYMRGIDSAGGGVHYYQPSSAILASMRKLLVK